MNTITQSEIELSERLRKACLEKGITEPRFVAQDLNGAWWHYEKTPVTDEEWTRWYPSYYDGCLLWTDLPNGNWRETLMEFVKPKIQAGKQYLQRNGDATFIISMESDGDCFTDGFRSWLQDGSFYGDQFHQFDLIAEYTGEPLADILQNTCEHCGKTL